MVSFKPATDHAGAYVATEAHFDAETSPSNFLLHALVLVDDMTKAAGLPAQQRIQLGRQAVSISLSKVHGDTELGLAGGLEDGREHGNLVVGPGGGIAAEV